MTGDIEMLSETPPIADAKGKIYDPPCGEGKYILTPKEQPVPRINGPTVFGVRPDSPFLYTIPASGKQPVGFSVDGLPEGLQVNESTGVISGKISNSHTHSYTVILHAHNELGDAEKEFKIRVGDTICLTPPMGWNSWNCWKSLVTQERVLASARAMVGKELLNHGWSYVNIDDAWQGRRGGGYNGIQADPGKFPDMGKMCAEIHAMGLKVGIYSTPWITSYAGYIGGSSDNEKGNWDESMDSSKTQKPEEHWRVAEYAFDPCDAAQWAEWGVDYLKYDWSPNEPCSIIRMANALRNCGRDIVYSLSNTAPLEHAELFGREVNCFRTAGDLEDRWDQKGDHLNIREQWDFHRTWMEEGVRGGAGHFPDADMLVVGDVVTSGEEGHPIPSRLTADEQYSHISLWILWASPLLIGCPVETMDEFTLNLLTNTEVLDVHQDSVATPGESIRIEDGIEIIVKELADGDKAIGLFNTNDESSVVTLEWEEAGLEGRKILRDVWRQVDIGLFEDRFFANVRAHGVVLIRTE